MMIDLSEDQYDLSKLLKSHGKQCYVSGGTVRDHVIGLESNDVDFNTDATPIELIEIFHKAGWRIVPDTVQRLADAGDYLKASQTSGFGLEFGTLRVRHPSGSEFYEVTTFRSEQEYSGRKPVRMSFETSVLVDLARRDLTINSIAYDPIDNELIDPYHGIDDINSKILRSVGDPVERIREDPLRMLRVARFASRFGFTINNELQKAMIKMADSITLISKERFSQEIMKMMKQSTNPSVGIDILVKTGIMKYIIPELIATMGIVQPSKYHKYDVYRHLLLSMDSAPQDKPFVRLVALLHDVAKAPIFMANTDKISRDIARSEKTFPWFKSHEKMGADMIEDILRRLRFSNHDAKKASLMVKNHMKIGSYRTALNSDRPNVTRVRRFIRNLGDESVITDLFELNRADVRGSGMPTDEIIDIIDHFERLVLAEIELSKIDPVIVPLNGHDIMREFKVGSSPFVGEVKRFVTSLYMDDRSLTGEKLLKIARERFLSE